MLAFSALAITLFTPFIALCDEEYICEVAIITWFDAYRLKTYLLSFDFFISKKPDCVFAFAVTGADGSALSCVSSFFVTCAFFGAVVFLGASVFAAVSVFLGTE